MYLMPLFLKRQYFFFETSTVGGFKYLISELLDMAMGIRLLLFPCFHLFCFCDVHYMPKHIYLVPQS